MVTKIAVIGMGYVGIPAAALLADVENFDVIGVQRRSKRSGWKIDYINDGKCPIKNEPDLPELLTRVVTDKGTFKVTDDISIIKTMDYILVDVQTPTDQNNEPRYESLREVSHQIGKLLQKGQTVIIESTVAPGTTDYIVKPILEEESGLVAENDFYLAFAYERVMVGRLIYNIVNYPRVCGGVGSESTKKTAWLYRHIMNAPVVETDALSSEMAKVVENTYRDVNIAFANEVALACESLGVDFYEVRNMVNNLPWIEGHGNPHRNLHLTGAGVGGHCLTKDPWLLKFGVDNYGKNAQSLTIIEKSRWLNKYMPVHTIKLLKESIKEAKLQSSSIKIAVLGAAFIENSDDPRNTPTSDIVKLLSKNGFMYETHDPYVRPEEVDFPLTDDLSKTVSNAHAIIILTAHKEYKDLDLQKMNKLMNVPKPILIDGRKTLNPKQVKDAGFIYRGIGRGADN